MIPERIFRLKWYAICAAIPGAIIIWWISSFASYYISKNVALIWYLNGMGTSYLIFQIVCWVVMMKFGAFKNIKKTKKNGYDIMSTEDQKYREKFKAFLETIEFHDVDEFVDYDMLKIVTLAQHYKIIVDNLICMGKSIRDCPVCREKHKDFIAHMDELVKKANK